MHSKLSGLVFSSILDDRFLLIKERTKLKRCDLSDFYHINQFWAKKLIGNGFKIFPNEFLRPFMITTFNLFLKFGSSWSKKCPKPKMMQLIWFSPYEQILGQKIDWKYFQISLAYFSPQFLIIGSSWSKRVRFWKLFKYLIFSL